MPTARHEDDEGTAMADPGSIDPQVAAAVGAGGIGVYFWNPRTSVLTWDDTLAALFDADRPGEDPFETWDRRIHPEDRERVLATFSEFDVAEAHFRLVLGNGSIRHLLSRATHVVRDESGAPTGVSGVAVDISAAMRQGELLGRMLDAISDGFLTLDREFSTTYVNRRALELLGMEATALLGISLFEAFPAAVGTKFEEAYRDVMESRRPRSFVEYYPEPLNMWIEVRAQPGDDGIVIYFQDVTERVTREKEREALLATERQARLEADGARRVAESTQKELAHKAAHDPLTGLTNRAELERLVTDRLGRPGGPLTLLFIDLDLFKNVNDTRGHAFGDALLVEIGALLQHELRSGDVAARLGGDEFVVVLDGLEAEGAETVAQRLLHAIREPREVDGYPVHVSASIGLAVAQPGATVTTLLRDADVALYRAKDAGRDRFAWFDAVANEEMLLRQALESDLRLAVAHGLELHFQPIYSLAHRRLVGVEALSRWHHPERGIVDPGVFIPLAEEAGLIRQLGLATTRSAALQAIAWSRLPDFTVWVNVSGRELDRPGYAHHVLDILDEVGLPGNRFGVEVTESVLTDEVTATHELSVLADAGVRIAIDDFGTGYSSLARLLALPISTLKIDRSFVADLDSPRGRGAVETVTQLGQMLRMTTVAEGVENVGQIAALRRMGVSHVSGHLLGRPVPPEALDLVHRPPELA